MNFFAKLLLIMIGNAYIYFLVTEGFTLYLLWDKYPSKLAAFVLFTPFIVIFFVLYILMHDDKVRSLQRTILVGNQKIKKKNEEIETLNKKVDHYTQLLDKIFALLDGTSNDEGMTIRRKSYGDDYFLRLRRGHRCVYVDEGSLITGESSTEQMVGTLNAIVIKLLAELTLMLVNRSEDEDRMLMLATLSLQLIDLRNRSLPFENSKIEDMHISLHWLCERLKEIATPRNFPHKGNKPRGRKVSDILSDILKGLHQCNHTQEAIGYAVPNTIPTDKLVTYAKLLLKPTDHERELEVHNILFEDAKPDIPKGFEDILNMFNQSDN